SFYISLPLLSLFSLSFPTISLLPPPPLSCPPGTAVLTHCTAETPHQHWHWGDSCQYCTTVCKERQLVSQECNRTHDQLCECIPGYHLVVEFCIKHTSCPPGFGVTALGTPEIDTACEACPQGLFSSRMSASEPCVPHRNCSELGLKTLRPGTPTQNTLCENKAEGSVLECSQHHTQCHTGENIQNIQYK
uniref:TNFR-Cys domain-containing protein n=1 Tax=Oncorhynchus tshawytscha TaxID=74940 RepID=A0A8C8M5G7_ONCTS